MDMATFSGGHICFMWYLGGLVEIIVIDFRLLKIFPIFV